MVLVTVGQDKPHDAVAVLEDVGHVREDDVDAGKGLVGESDAAVDDEDLIALFEHEHVLADLQRAAEGD